MANRRITRTIAFVLPLTMSSAIIPTSFVRRQATVRVHSLSKVLLSSTSSGNNDSLDGQYAKSYKLNGIGTRTRVDIETDTGHTLCTDIPKSMGGTDAAPQPVETLMAAWMGCTQATAIFVGRHMQQQTEEGGGISKKGRVLIEKLEFENIQAFRDERGALHLPIQEIPEIPSRIQRITGTIRVHLRGNSLLKEDQLHLLQEQTEIRCPVANMMLASGCSIDVKWIAAKTE